MLLTLLAKWPRAAMIVLTFLFLLSSSTEAYAVSTTDVIEMFKYTYGATQLLYLAAEEIVLWRILQRKQAPLGGRGQFLMPIRTRNTGVFVGHTEGGAKTTRRAQPDTTEASFALQEFHGIYDLSWKMIQDARKDEYAFERALDFMDNAFRTRVFRLLNAELLGYGRGELGILPAADNDTIITVRALPLTDTGMIVDLMDASDNDTKLLDARTVTAIDIPNRTITTSGAAAAGTAAGDYYTVADSVSSAGSLHMAGILAWIDSANPAAVVGNLGGINRSTAGNEFWQSTVLDNSGTNRPMTEDLLLQGLDITRERGGKPVTDFMSNLNIIRRYHESLREDTFFAMGQVKEFGAGVGKGRDEGGMSSGADSDGETIYRFSGIPWRAEMFMDSNRLIGFNRDHFFIGHGENEVPQPLSEIFDGMVNFFTDTANTTFEVVSYWQGELICDNPPASFTVRDIAES